MPGGQVTCLFVYFINKKSVFKFHLVSWVNVVHNIQSVLASSILELQKKVLLEVTCQ